MTSGFPASQATAARDFIKIPRLYPAADLTPIESIDQVSYEQGYHNTPRNAKFARVQIILQRTIGPSRSFACPGASMPHPSKLPCHLSRAVIQKVSKNDNSLRRES
jgi:hypothetical protein